LIIGAKLNAAHPQPAIYMPGRRSRKPGDEAGSSSHFDVGQASSPEMGGWKPP